MTVITRPVMTALIEDLITNQMHQNPLADSLTATLRYYGISPWEIEVLYGFLNSHFTITQEETEPYDKDFVSLLDVDIPLTFNDAFFEWFEFRRWEKVKAVFKEMKRRRGSGNAIKVIVRFSGVPGIVFTVDTEDKQWFDNAVEKIDSVLELLPYHLDPEKVPAGVTGIRYRFDPKTVRWRLDAAESPQGRFSFRGDVWKKDG